MPLPLLGNASRFKQVLCFERTRYIECQRWLCDVKSDEQFDRLLHALNALLEMTGTGGTEHEWKQRVTQCTHALVTARLHGLDGEFDACLTATYGALQDAGIL